MNPNTNELIDAGKYDSGFLKEKGYVPVPDRLQKFAEQELDGKESVIIPDNNSPLAKWAKKLRKKLGQKI
jgi:hypothetical protein